jgi:hypothetical protein
VLKFKIKFQHQRVKHIYLLPVASYKYQCMLFHLQGDHYVICSKIVRFLQCCYIGCTVTCNIYCIQFFKYTRLLWCLNQYAVHPSRSLTLLKNVSENSVGSCLLLWILAIRVCAIGSIIVSVSWEDYIL